MIVELFINDNSVPFILSETGWLYNVSNGIHAFSGNGPFARKVQYAMYIINNIIFIKYKKHDC